MATMPHTIAVRAIHCMRALLSCRTSHPTRQLCSFRAIVALCGSRPLTTREPRYTNARMTRISILALAALLVSALGADAQQPPAGGQITGQSPDRGRPTRHDDEQPLLDFKAYFTGAPWAFEWDLPESPLGAAGT